MYLTTGANIKLWGEREAASHMWTLRLFALFSNAQFPHHSFVQGMPFVLSYQFQITSVNSASLVSRFHAVWLWEMLKSIISHLICVMQLSCMYDKLVKCKKMLGCIKHTCHWLLLQCFRNNYNSSSITEYPLLICFIFSWCNMTLVEMPSQHHVVTQLPVPLSSLRATWPPKWPRTDGPEKPERSAHLDPWGWT